jgi:hypothetical protein
MTSALDGLARSESSGADGSRAAADSARPGRRARRGVGEGGLQCGFVGTAPPRPLLVLAGPRLVQQIRPCRTTRPPSRCRARV